MEITVYMERPLAHKITCEDIKKQIIWGTYYTLKFNHEILKFNNPLDEQNGDERHCQPKNEIPENFLVTFAANHRECIIVLF